MPTRTLPAKGCHSKLPERLHPERAIHQVLASLRCPVTFQRQAPHSFPEAVGLPARRDRSSLFPERLPQRERPEEAVFVSMAQPDWQARQERHY